MNPFRFLKRNLRGRIIFLVGLWMVALAGILLISSQRGSQELSDRVLNERQHLAQALADNLDYILKSNLIILQEVALNARFGFEKGPLENLKSALREAYLQSIFTEGVFLVDRAGKTVWMEPQRPSRETEGFSSLRPIREVLQSGRPELSNLIVEGKRRIYGVVPIRNSRNELSGAVGGELDPEGDRFQSLVHLIRLGDTTYIDLVDGHGTVLASTKPGRAFIDSDHGRFLAGLIRDKKSVVGTCHTCHEQKGIPGREREREVIAFAPLANAPWGLSIRQAESEALAPAFAMEKRFLFIGSFMILLALLFAWGVARSVTKPLGSLTEAAKRIAKGDLSAPVHQFGEDEIGSLAQSLDEMRTMLKASLDVIGEGKRDLEKKVQERTRELEALYRELQKKEDARGELLRKVIRVQEEERKRIARELHDETSQALATLLLSVETSAIPAADPQKERLARMRAMANRALDSVHRLIFDLRPSVLDDLGLVSAIRWVAENRLESLGIDVVFEVVGTERRLKPEIETTLFRIGQEAVSNVAKHAEANSVKLASEFGDRFVRLQVEDNGKGFDLEEVSSSADRVIGILGMKERAALVDGTIVIDSEPEKGTRLAVEIPLANARVLKTQGL